MVDEPSALAPEVAGGAGAGQDLSGVLAEIRRQIALRREELASCGFVVEEPAYIGLSLPPIDFGVALHFCRDGNGLPYMGAGWSGPEVSFTWSIGECAELLFPWHRQQGDLLLSLHMAPFLGGGLEAQPIEVCVSGHLVAALDVTEPREYQVMLFDHHLAGRNVIAVQLHIGEPRSPKEAGIGSDERRLGVALSSVVIEKA